MKISQAEFGQIIILNGTPRSGKSSLAAEIQETFPGVWMNMGVDRFMEMTPKHYLPGIGLRPGGERPDLEALIGTLYRAMYDAIAAHSRLGLNVVVDVGHHDAYAAPQHILPACAQQLLRLPVLFVGVRCPLEEIIKRRQQTGWHKGDLTPERLRFVRLWQQEVHRLGIYDLEVDTSLQTPAACANAIRKHLEAGLSMTACQKLASLA